MNNKLLKALARCSIADKNMIFTLFNVSGEELEKYIEQEIIERKLEQVNLEVNEYFTLTDKGEDILKEKFPSFGEIYRGFIIEHDKCLMEFYLNLTEKEQESWITRDDMIKNFRLPGTIDGAFINKDGEWEGIEVLRSDANPSSVEKAESFIKEANISKMNYILY